MTIVTTSNWKYIFILVSIHKSCIVYFEKKFAVAIGHGNSFFLVMEKSWKIIVELEMWPVPNVMFTLPNIGGTLCSTPQSLADAHY